MRILLDPTQGEPIVPIAYNICLERTEAAEDPAGPGQGEYRRHRLQETQEGSGNTGLDLFI